MNRSVIILAALAISGCVSNSHEPKILKKVYPVYPYYAVSHRIEGVVKFNYDVDSNGKVSEMRIIESTPDHLFDDAVISAVSKWRFEQGVPANNLKSVIIMKIQK